jgi:hypothetical protein
MPNGAFLSEHMPRFKTTAEALKIVHNKDQIRNLGIIAHVDHGIRVD